MKKLLKKNNPPQWEKYIITGFHSDREQLIACLYGMHCLGLEEQPDRLEAYFDRDAAVERITSLKSFLSQQGDRQAHIQQELIRPADWHLRWQERFKPIQLTSRIAISPSWNKTPVQGDIQLKVHPGMAFGTGTHASTQLTLMLMDKHLKPGMSVLDAGCGSGILTIAALKMEAARVDAYDNDPDIRETFNTMLKLNQIHTDYRLVIKDAIRITDYHPYALILSNIQRHTNQILLKKLMQHSFAGQVIFSGILKDEGREFAADVINSGNIITEQSVLGEWIAFLVDFHKNK